jgi:hypothetical protein
MPREGALSLAIALFHAPGLRHGWRREPLPTDIGRLLALVGGEPRRLEQAAATLGVVPDDLLQAARFYVQEILLFADAGDRRLLGLADGDDPETIRSHYRYLQSWLHPDRGGASRAETVHAARINAAWNRLRATTAQGAVTATQAERVAPGHPPTAASTTRVQHWVRVEQETQRRPKRWLLAIPVAVAIAGGWLWLASHPPSGTGDAWSGEPAATATATAPADGSTGANAAATEVRSSPREEVASTAADTQRPLPPAPTVRLPVATPATIAAKPSNAHATDGSGVLAGAPRERPSRNMRTTESIIAASSPARPSSPPADVPPSPPLLASVPAPAAIAKAQPPAAPLSAHDAPRDRNPATTSIPAPVPDLAGRNLAAQQRGDALLAYLTRPQAVPPPIWRSGQALDSAAAIQRDLAGGGRRRPQVLHDQARWHIEPGQARLQVPVEPADRSGPRLLRAGLRWDNDAWWVESIALEDAR